MLPLTWLLGLQATGCNWKRLNDCTDQVENAVFFDEVFSENESVVISNMGKPLVYGLIQKFSAVIIRENVTMEKIRIGECGYLTVADTGKSEKINVKSIKTVKLISELKKDTPIKLSAMHIDVVDGGELQVRMKFYSLELS